MTKKNIFRIIIITLFILLVNVKITNAAISVPSKTVNSGESFSILVSSNVPVVSYKVTMTGNGGLTFVTSSGGTGAGTATITDAKATGMTSLATYTFKAPTVTTDTTYTVSFSATIMEDENFNPVADSTAVATIKVKAPAAPTTPSNGGSSNSGNSTTTKPSTGGSTTTKPTEEKKSNDSSLKGLTVEGFELYPEFNADTHEYNIRVTNDITKLTITPTVNHEKASYKIQGATEELEVGKNVITVVVTAEDGSTTNYVINVTRNRENLSVEHIKFFYTDENEQTQELVLTPEFSADVFEYDLGTISYLISKLDVDIFANFEEATIEIIGNENLAEGENTITITVTMPSENEEETDEVLTYTVKVNKETEPALTLIGKIKKWFKGITGTISTWFDDNLNEILISSLGVSAVALAGLSVYMVIDYKKYKLMVKKIAELTKLNNTETVEASEKLETNLEEKMQLEETEIKPKGRHF